MRKATRASVTSSCPIQSPNGMTQFNRDKVNGRISGLPISAICTSRRAELITIARFAAFSGMDVAPNPALPLRLAALQFSRPRSRVRSKPNV